MSDQTPEARLAAADERCPDCNFTAAEIGHFHITAQRHGLPEHDTLAADLALAAAVRERFPNMTLVIEEDLLAPGDIDPDNGRTVERVTGTAADPVVVYAMTDQTPEARKCVEQGCDEPAGTRWSPYWCERHDKERRDRITEQLDGLVAAAKEATDD